MKRIIFTIMAIFCLAGFNATAEIANYVFVMFYGNDSEPLLTTIQVDESLKAKLEKRNIKFDWSETPVPRDFLVLEGKGIRAECDLTEYNETWCVTDATQRIIGISELFPVGRETSWFRISEKDGEFAIEAPGNDISVEFYKSTKDEWPEDDVEIKKGKRFIFNFEGKTAKIGPEGIQFIITRK